MRSSPSSGAEPPAGGVTPAGLTPVEAGEGTEVLEEEAVGKVADLEAKADVFSLFKETDGDERREEALRERGSSSASAVAASSSFRFDAGLFLLSFDAICCVFEAVLRLRTGLDSISVPESDSDSDSTSSELLGLEGVFRCFFEEATDEAGDDRSVLSFSDEDFSCLTSDFKS